jgi:hypothetical protein
LNIQLPLSADAIGATPDGQRLDLAARLYLALYRHVVGPAVDLHFAHWRRRHPGGSFADYYVDEVRRKLARGMAHKTLGKRDRKGGGREYDREGFARSGRRNFALLGAYGLRPDDLCVDYGCGSLRVGQHAMRFLEPGRYIGLDVADIFYRDGVELLGPELIAARRPLLATISEPSLLRVERMRPRFIYSFAVLHHVPPAEIPDFLYSIARLAGPGTTVCIQFEESDRIRRTAPKSWSYPADYLIVRLSRVLPYARIGVDRPYTTQKKWNTVNRAMLVAV